MVVYLDVLFMINLAMNIVIILFVAQILDLKPSFLKILWAALLGNILLMEVVYPYVVFFKSLEFRLLVSIAMVMIAFNPIRLRDFVKILGFFYLISFMVGGGVLAFFYLINMDRAFTDGIFLFNSISIPWWILLVSSSFMLLFFKFLWPLLYNIMVKDKLLASVTVMFRGKSASFPSLIDTGNDLSDPVTSDPVIIVEFDAIRCLLDEKYQTIIESMVEGDFSYNSMLSASLTNHIPWRLIPYESIGKSYGIMVGFKPDLVTITYENRIIETKNVIIGLHKRQLSSDYTYRALLNPGLLKG